MAQLACVGGNAMRLLTPQRANLACLGPAGSGGECPLHPGSTHSASWRPARQSMADASKGRETPTPWNLESSSDSKDLRNPDSRPRRPTQTNRPRASTFLRCPDLSIHRGTAKSLGVPHVLPRQEATTPQEARQAVASWPTSFPCPWRKPRSSWLDPSFASTNWSNCSLSRLA